MEKSTIDKTELEEVVEHQAVSERYLEPSRARYLDYESMVLSEHRESGQNENKVFDPRISTIEIERTSRVAAQRPSGKAFAVSSDDVGKNLLMNLLIRYQLDNANEQWDFIIKQMMWSFWSRVYGVYYALTPWRITSNYVGNELLLLNIYDSFPQPNTSVDDADWFIAGNRPTIQWLEAQDAEVWNMNEIKELKAELKNSSGDTKQNDNSASHTQTTQLPTQEGDQAFPRIQTYTEYRGDKWITWAKRINTSKGREYLLRVITNDDLEGKLPVVAKYSIPMMGGDPTSPIGLGPFQRGKSLQFATNSLINMKLVDTRERLRPQLHVNPANVVMSSIKYAPGAYWFMNNPGEDVKAFQKGSDATSDFNSAYGLMVSAMLNQAGTTDTTSSQYTTTSLGKTPAAIKSQTASQGAQDFWEQTMMETSMGQVLERWVMNNTKNLDEAQTIRVFGQEVQQIASLYPDVLEMFSEESGSVKVSSELFQEKSGKGKKVVSTPVKFDYKIQTGSMTKPSLEVEVENLMDFVNLLDERPNFIAKLNQEGSDISATQLLREIITKRGMREDQIIVQAQPQQVDGQGQPAPPSGSQPEGPPQAQPLPPQRPVPQFEDPDINAVAQELLGGNNGIPISA